MNGYKLNLLEDRIYEALRKYPLEKKHSYTDENVNKAMSIFQSIKKFEKELGELEFAKNDLEKIFGISSRGMTKNQIYNLHCSKVVNAIALLAKNGECKY